MTLIEALPRAEGERIEIPVGAIIAGVEIVGTVSEAWLNTAYAAYVGLTVPLTAGQYQNLLDMSSTNWRLNWERFRAQGII